MTSLTLPLCPSANRYWRLMRGRAVKSDEARNYAAVVRTLARAARLARIEDPDPVAVRIHWKRRERRGDLDNRIKVLLDSLQGIAFDNDHQVREIHAWVTDGHHENQMVVSVGTPVGAGITFTEGAA